LSNCLSRLLLGERCIDSLKIHSPKVKIFPLEVKIPSVGSSHGRGKMVVYDLLLVYVFGHPPIVVLETVHVVFSFSSHLPLSGRIWCLHHPP
jgi:hypothetical protein